MMKKRSPGFWKLNVSWLENAEYQNSIQKLIQDTCEENKHLNPNLIWDYCKIKTKELSIRFAIQAL